MKASGFFDAEINKKVSSFKKSKKNVIMNKIFEMRSSLWNRIIEKIFYTYI